MADGYPEIFDGYRIVRPAIGRGGAGVVHEALAPDGRRVAVKILDRPSIEAKLLKHFEGRRESAGGDSTEPTEETRRAYEKYIERFKEEYHVLVGLDHPNIAKVHHIGFYEGQFYIVSEFVDGKPIAAHVRGWEPLKMIPFFIRALSGLDFIHRNGLVHLDIKSENILVQTKDGEPQVKIIDFGLAMAPSDYGGGFMGSVQTMAPEVAFGLKDQVDARADLFSFGVVMYQCITWGWLPFSRLTKSDRETIRRDIEFEAQQDLRPPSRSHRSGLDLVPESLDTIVRRLIAHRPEDRFYSNARAVMNALATHMPDAFADSPDTRGAYLRPERGKLIGRDREIELIEKNIQTLVEGKQPAISIFSIIGEDRMGKTHFLKHLRDIADKHVETIFIHSFTFPASEDVLEEKTAGLSGRIAENVKPVLVLIDNLNELSANSKAVAVIGGFIRLAIERRHKPDVYAGIQPTMFIFTTNSQITWIADALDGDAGAMQIIELRPFNPKDIETYLLSTPALQGKEIPVERVDALHRRTSGVPGELDETLEALDESGVIFDADGQIVLADIPPSLQKIPHSTRERLLARYRAFTPTERHVADVMACWCLKPFLPPLRSGDIFVLIGGAALTQALHALAQMDFIEHDAAEDVYAFFDRDYAPGLIHEEMDGEACEQLHSLIADHLSAKRTPDRNAIMYHRALGADKVLAFRGCIYLGRDLLYREGRCRVAIELFERALTLIPTTKQVRSGSVTNLRAYILSLLADACLLSDAPQDGERAKELWGSIAENADISGREAKQWGIVLHLKAITHHLQTGNYDDAKKLIDGLAIVLKDRKNSISYILLLNYEARYYYELALQQPEHLIDLLNKAKELYKKSEQLELQIHGFDPTRVKNNSLPLVLRALDQLSAAAEKLKKQIDERELNIFSQATSYTDLADIYRMERKYSDALDCATRALSVADETRLGNLYFHAHDVLASIYHDMDDFKKSLDERNRQIAASACIDNAATFKRHSSRIWTHMGHCYKELKDWDRATVYFDAAIVDAKESYYLMSAHQGLGEVCFHKGDLGRMMENFAKAEELLEGMPKNAMADSHRARIAELKAGSEQRIASISKRS